MTTDDANEPLRRGLLVALILGLGRLDPPADVLARAEASAAIQRAAERRKRPPLNAEQAHRRRLFVDDGDGA